MNTKDIITNMAIFLKKPEILTYINDIKITTQNNANFEINEEAYSATNQSEYTNVKSDISLFLNCINYTMKEITKNYFPLVKEENIEINGNFLYSTLSSDLCYIISLNKNGTSVRFEKFDDHITAEKGFYIIKYAYIPNFYGTNSVIPNLGGKINENLVCFGALSHYCLINALYEEANIYEIKYKNELLISGRNKHEMIVKGRRWL